MAPVSRPYRGDARRMTGRRQPVVYGGANSPARQRRLAVPVVPRNQQQDPVSRGNCSLQPMVDCLPRPIEAVPVEIEDSIGFDPARAEAPVPTAIER